MDCPLCKYPNIKTQGDGALSTNYFVDCVRCGNYSISDQCLLASKGRLEEIGYILSGLTREINEEGITIDNRPKFLTTNLDEYLKDFRIPNINSVEDKAKKLLQRIKDRTKFFGEKIELDSTKDYSLAYAKNEDEFRALFALLNKKKLTNIGTDYREYPGGTAKIVLEATGWELANNIKGRNKNSEQGFIALWIKEDRIEFKEAIEKGIEDAKFKHFCVWGKHFSDTIIDKALGEIRNSRFLVIDLTGSRSSVFFEAGFAHGLGIEIIYVYDKNSVEKGSELDFYVKHYQCHSYENPEQLRTIVNNAVKARIKKS